MTDADLENPSAAMTDHVLRVTADMTPADLMQMGQVIISHAICREANINSDIDAAELARRNDMWATRLRGHFQRRQT